MKRRDRQVNRKKVGNGDEEKEREEKNDRGRQEVKRRDREQGRR